MAYSSGTFSGLFNWNTDPVRAEKIFNERLKAEFDGIAGGLTNFGGSSVTINTGSDTPYTDSVFDVAGAGRFVATNPEMLIDFPTFDSGIPSYPVGFSVLTNLSGALTATTAGGLVGQTVADATATGTTEPWGVWGGFANKAAVVGYGVVGVINNYTDATPLGAAHLGIIRGDVATSANLSTQGISAFRAVSETTGTEQPNDGLFVYNSSSTNAFKNGVFVASASDYGVRVGFGSASSAVTIMPDYPFALVLNDGSQPFEVDNTGRGKFNGLTSDGGTGTNSGIKVTDGTLGGQLYVQTGPTFNIGTSSNHPLVLFTNDTAGITLSIAQALRFHGYTAGALSTDASGNVSAGTLSLANGGTAATTASGARTSLGLGTAAVQNTGTSGGNVPLMNGANTWSGTQHFTKYDFTTANSADALDLDTVTTPGEYSGNSNTNGAVSGSFFLKVYGNAAADTGFLIHQFMPLNTTTADVYFRACASGTWGPWRQATLT